MGIARTVSPRSVQQLIATEEIPYRSRTMSIASVSEIFRYGAPVGSTILRFDNLVRGMNLARDLIRKAESGNGSFQSGIVIIAGTLSAGKGRFEREWHAPDGGLWMTVALANTLIPEYTRFYPLAAGVACCEALRRYQLDVKIKWVNDLHVNGRKIAGILTESFNSPKYGEEYILLGIGINVNNETFPETLAPQAVSMKNLMGCDVLIEPLIARVLAKLAWNIGLLHLEEKRFLDRGGSRYEGNHVPREEQYLLNEWRRLSDSIGRQVQFGYDVQENPQYLATVMDIDASGGLILRRLDDGRETRENAGEIIYCS